MNEFVKIGKADEYVEVCMDWQMTDQTKILYYFRDALTTSSNLTEDLQEKIAEVFEMNSYYEEKWDQ